MAQVTIRINGYSYVVGCEDGQEPHLQAMAAEVENRIDSIKALGGASGEARLLVLAALLMADELHDQGAALEQARAGAPVVRQDPAVTRKLERMALKAEKIAQALQAEGEAPAAKPG